MLDIIFFQQESGLHLLKTIAAYYDELKEVKFEIKIEIKLICYCFKISVV